MSPGVNRTITKNFILHALPASRDPLSDNSTVNGQPSRSERINFELLFPISSCPAADRAVYDRSRAPVNEVRTTWLGVGDSKCGSSEFVKLYQSFRSFRAWRN